MSLQITSEEEFTCIRRRLRSPRDAAQWVQACPEITGREWLAAVFVDRQWELKGLHVLQAGDACPIDPLPGIPDLIESAHACRATCVITVRQHDHLWLSPGIDAPQNIERIWEALDQAELIWAMNLILDPSGLVWVMRWYQEGGGKSGTNGVSGCISSPR